MYGIQVENGYESFQIFSLNPNQVRALNDGNMVSYDTALAGGLALTLVK